MFNSIRQLLFGLSFLVALQSCSQKTSQIVAPQSSGFEEFLKQTVEENKLPGLMAAVIDDNAMLELGAAGVREYGNQEAPMTVNDIIHIGSCTKAMTSFLISKLVEKDLLSWETTILDLYPEWRDSIHEDYHQKTLHDFVTHTSGTPANVAYHLTDQSLNIKERRAGLVMANLQKEAPHSGYLYSNFGYLIAGHLAEKVTDKSWEMLMKEYVFTPLEMTSAGFGPPGSEDVVDQPRGHSYSSSHVWTPQYRDNLPILGPAGTVHLSIQDWAIFIRHLFLEDEAMQKHNFLFTPKPDSDYACGWIAADRDWAKGTAYWHNGSNNMWYTLVWIAPETNRAYLLSTNSFSFTMPKIMDGIVSTMINDFSN